MDWLQKQSYKILGPCGYKLQFKLKGSKLLVTMCGVIIWLLSAVPIAIYVFSAYNKLGSTQQFLQYAATPVDSQQMVNDAFPGGIINYDFNNETYPKLANSLSIHDSQFGRDCDAYWKAIDEKGINRTKAAHVKLKIFSNEWKMFPLECTTELEGYALWFTVPLEAWKYY